MSLRPRSALTDSLSFAPEMWRQSVFSPISCSVRLGMRPSCDAALLPLQLLACPASLTIELACQGSNHMPRNLDYRKHPAAGEWVTCMVAAQPAPLAAPTSRRPRSATGIEQAPVGLVPPLRWSMGKPHERDREQPGCYSPVSHTEPTCMCFPSIFLRRKLKDISSSSPG